MGLMEARSFPSPHHTLTDNIYDQKESYFLHKEFNAQGKEYFVWIILLEEIKEDRMDKGKEGIGLIERT